MTSSPATTTSIATAMRWIALVGILIVTTTRVMSVFAPHIYFDADPMVFGEALAAHPMSMSFALDVLLLLFASMGLAAEWRSGRGLDTWLVVLPLLATPAIFIHGFDDAGDLWRGSTWLAAMLAASTLLHLHRDHTMRIVTFAILLGLLVPLIARGTLQVTVEYQDNIKAFEDNPGRFLGQRGWEPDSAAAQIFERRLRQRQPVGWFVTTNVLATLLAVGVTALLGLVVGMIYTTVRQLTRGRSESGGVAIAGTIAAAAVMLGAISLLAVSGSRGAMIAMMAGAVAMAVAGGLFMLVSTIGGSRLARLGERPGLVVAILTVGALLGVVIRGAVLPESFLNELSLLFRWHYMTGAMQIIASEPLLGVGPDGFQEAYTQVRPPRSPEEVTNAHSVFIDWGATLGLGGIAWIGWMAMAVLRRPDPAAVVEPDPELTAADLARITFRVAVPIMTIGGLLALWSEHHVLDESQFIGRIGAIMAGLFVVAPVVAASMFAVGQRTLMAVATGAVAVLLVHAQIEMTLVQPGSVVWGLALISVFGVCGRGRSMPILPVIILILMAFITTFAVIPSFKQQDRVREAAQWLYPPEENLLEQVAQRRYASDVLVEAFDLWTSDTTPLYRAALQLILAAGTYEDAQYHQGPLREAMELLDHAIESRDTMRERVLRSNVQRELFRIGAGDEFLDGALADALDIANRDPHAIESWKRLGDIEWIAGRPEAAAAHYRRALACHDNFELDPLKQLPERDLEVIRRRVASTE